MKSHLLTMAVLLGGTILAGSAMAADFIEEPIYAPPPVLVEEPVSTSGWYLRGDVGYVFSGESDGYYRVLRTAMPAYYEEFRYGKFEYDSGFLVGGGLGYRLNNFARFDVTADYFSSDLRGTSACPGARFEDCRFDDKSKTDIWTVMANAYVDIGTYGKITPYVGAGAGFAHVSYDALSNKFVCSAGLAAQPGTLCGQTFTHGGMSKWRFAGALMAGATIDISHKLKLDAGYRYMRVASGDAFGFDSLDLAAGASGTQGYDNGFDLHQVRAGLRYEFGGGGFGKGKAPAYVAAPVYEEPIYQDAVYK